MTQSVSSPEQSGELARLRAALQDAESEAAAGVARDGKASERVDDRVAGILKRIGEITGTEKYAD